MPYKTIELKKTDHIMMLTMNNPQVLNALSGETIKELADAVDHIEADNDVRVVIVTGSGKAFVAGADIAYMKDLTPFEAIGFAQDTTGIYEKIEKSKKIYIGAVNGFALGGGFEFALSLDIRIASEKAKFGLPEASLGILPGGGGTQRLTRLIGRAKALELMVTCEYIKAEQAFILGLVNSVVPAEELIDEAILMAHKILKNAPKSVMFIKECVKRGGGGSLEEGIEYEKNMFGLCFSTADQKEGMASFLEKRTPVYRNN